MWNPPSKTDLDLLPALYETDKVESKNKSILMHFFIGGCDWFIAEYDPKTQMLFGFTILNNDLQNAEWGYTSLDDLNSMMLHGWMEIERDLYWDPRFADQIKKICWSQGW